LVSEYLKHASIKNGAIEAEISEWWQEVRQEYRFDENDSYSAYAKNVIMHWSCRILFAHLIKRFQNCAYEVDKLDYNCTPTQANKIFNKITEQCDFFNVFSPMSLNDILPDETWDSLIELSMFLRANGINTIDQKLLQNILENCINSTRRELNGQFTTPQVLAEILVRITVHDWTDDTIDPCCGTGTIAKEILVQKKSRIGIDKAIKTSWASDKYKVPLQIANISLTSSDTFNKANRIFQKNALSLCAGNRIPIVDPSNGEKIIYALPLFGSICSNLPFVSFESIPRDDRNYIETCTQYRLDGKSDLSFSVALHLSSILKEDGYLGIITSNSWLGTKSGELFFNELKRRFNIRQVHISGKGRWFTNADIVTTILILQKKGNINVNETNFYIWRKSLSELKFNGYYKNKLINAAILNRNENNEVVNSCIYDQDEIEELKQLGLSYNSLFHDVKWVLDLKGILCPISRFFNVLRGSRRGWDKLFFPENYELIEEEFLIPALFNGKDVDFLSVQPDRMGFCCSKDMDDLEKNYPQAYRHIMKFKNGTNKTGEPLSKVLKRSNEEWYEMKPNEISDIFTIMNPNDRIFFGRFQTPSFINQRLIGFKSRDEDVDVELCHALMNSVIMKFFIEAVGFGRGLGVLDINKKNVANCLMLNPMFLSEKSIVKIKTEFKKICNKPIISIEEELIDDDWIKYNMIILEAFNISSYYSKITDSIKSLRKIRKTAREMTTDTYSQNVDSHFRIYEDIEDRIAAEI
ncbi:MAG: N-6 DNA methylase, partial [Ruminococcus sp.]|nr:N-6 DNA methylase [Ruminococcus sp.]